MYCKECGKEMKYFVGQMFGEGKDEEVCLYCGHYESIGTINQDQLKQLRKEEIEEAEDEERESLYEEVSFFGVVRLEAEDQDDEEKQYECDDFELDSEEASKFLSNLEKKGELVSSGYVGNAYFIDTTKEENFTNFVEILTKDMNGKLPEKSKLNVERNYFPDWASEIKKQSEEEDN